MRPAPRSWMMVVAMVGGFWALASPAPAPAAEAARVLMVDNEPDLTNWHYEPAEVTVPAGATVVWFNKGEQDHTVTADDKSFDSGMKRPGTSWAHTFTKAGQYSYYCAPHPWMKGTVRVVAAREAAEAPATATTATTAAPPTSAPPSTAPPAAGPTATTFPASLGVQDQEAPAAPEEPAPPSPPAPAAGGSGERVAAPAAHGRDSGGNVVGTTALVVLPTLGALAIGARLRRRSEAIEV